MVHSYGTESGGYSGYGGSMGGSGGDGMGGYGGEIKASMPKPYNFDYQANGIDGNHFRSEQGDASGNVRGSYGYTDSQGLYRKVEYTAGPQGFQATVKTNEPGTDSKPISPVDVNMFAQQPPAGIQEKYNRRGGMGGGIGIYGGMSRYSGMGGHGGYGGIGGYGGMDGESSGLFAGIGRSGSGKSV